MVVLFSPQALVYIASVPYDGDVDRLVGIINGIDNSIITNADSPEIILAGKLFTSGRSRIFSKRFNFL